jgi:hypothetical protein
MIALIQTLLYALDIYWWIVVLAVVFPGSTRSMSSMAATSSSG